MHNMICCVKLLVPLLKNHNVLLFIKAIYLSRKYHALLWSEEVWLQLLW